MAAGDRESAGKHGFPGAGRAYQEQVVTTGGHNLQRSFALLLADNISRSS
jgi:hypothetical protein